MSDVFPPVSPTDLLPDEQPRPKWPKVIGIISISWGGLGLVCGGCGLLALAFMPTLMGGQFKPEDLPPSMKFNAMQWGIAGFGMIMTVVLVAAGITCVKRLPMARWLHLVCAIAGFPQVALSVYNQVQTNAVMEQWVRENPSSPFAKGFSPTGAMFGMIVTVVLGLAYPLFLLVWFGLIKRKPEDFGPPDEPIRV